MSRIDELIMEHCPAGVRYMPLGETCQIKNGRDWKTQEPGRIPVYGSGGRMDVTVKQPAYHQPTVLLPRKGSLNVQYVSEPFWNVDTVFYTICDLQLMEPKFLFHFMKTVDLGPISTSSTRPSLTQSALAKLRVPVPPLEIQRAIVDVLDKFTKLEAELEAELEARKKQYTYYRNDMLTFTPETEFLPLGDLANNLDRMRKPVTRDARTPGEIPYYGASGIVDYVSDYIFDGDYLLVSEDGANLLARSTPIAFSISGKTWVNNHAHVLEFDTYVERRFVEIFLNSIDLAPYISGAAQPKLNKANLNRIPIPNPAAEEKARIVAILDKFDALVNDLSSGLPAEIAARRKQYEYYRDQLLAFKELTP